MKFLDLIEVNNDITNEQDTNKYSMPPSNNILLNPLRIKKVSVFIVGDIFFEIVLYINKFELNNFCNV